MDKTKACDGHEPVWPDRRTTKEIEVQRQTHSRAREIFQAEEQRRARNFSHTLAEAKKKLTSRRGERRREKAEDLQRGYWHRKELRDQTGVREGGLGKDLGEYKGVGVTPRDGRSTQQKLESKGARKHTTLSSESPSPYGTSTDRKVENGPTLESQASEGPIFYALDEEGLEIVARENHRMRRKNATNVERTLGSVRIGGKGGKPKRQCRRKELATKRVRGGIVSKKKGAFLSDGGRGGLTKSAKIEKKTQKKQAVIDEKGEKLSEGARRGLCGKGAHCGGP